MALSESLRLETQYKHVIIKEEVIISDIKEEPYDFYENEASFTNVLNQIEPTDQNLKPDYTNSTVIKNESKRQKEYNNSRKTTCSRNQKVNADQKLNSSPNKNSTNASAALQTDIAAALITVSKAHCSKCAKKTKVIARKARCAKCKTPLIYHCESCNTTYKTYTDLCYHLKWKHALSSAKVNCKECGKMFSDLKGLKAHQRVVHGIFDTTKQQKSLTCDKCGKTFAFSTESVIHKRDCGKGLIYKCDNCSFTTNYKAHLITHMKGKHLNFDLKCKNCKKVFTNKKSMNRHWSIYCGKGKMLICYHCDRELYRKDEMIAHIRSKHPRVFGKRASLRK